MKEATRRELLLIGLATVLGLAGGGAAWLLVHLIGIITNVALFHRWGTDIPPMSTLHPNGTLVLAAVAGATVVSLLARWSPVIRGHGLPEAMEAVLTRSSRIAPRAALAKPTSAAVAIGTGGPFGAEGPIIVTGGALGSLIGQVLRVSARERKILLACGAAAGMSAVFGAPIAAVVLAIELLLFEFSTQALVPLVVSSSVAGAMHAALFSAGPLFHVPPHTYDGLSHLPVYVVLGLACGLAATVICKGLYLIEAGFRRLPIHEFWHPLIGALGFALIGLFVPRVLGVGYDTINDVLASKFALGTLAVLMLAKLGAWWIALGSGTSGGTLAPLLLIGGAFGSLFGALVHEVVPGVGISAGALALVAMAATFGASARVPFTAFVFAFELTRDYRSILPLMLATVVAEVTCRAFLDHGLMTEKLARRGVIVPTGYEPDILRHTLVGAAMSATPVALCTDSTVEQARALARAQPHGSYPVVDEGILVGLLSREALTGAGLDGDALVHTLSETDPPSVAPEDTLEDVLDEIVSSGIDHVPVVDDDGRLVGICTRADVLDAQARRRDHERHEDRTLGFRRSRPRRDPAGNAGA